MGNRSFFSPFLDGEDGRLFAYPPVAVHVCGRLHGLVPDVVTCECLYRQAACNSVRPELLGRAEQGVAADCPQLIQGCDAVRIGRCQGSEVVLVERPESRTERIGIPPVALETLQGLMDHTNDPAIHNITDPQPRPGAIEDL